MASGERFYHDVSLRGPVPDRLLARLPDPRAPDPDLASRLADIAKAHAADFFGAGAPGFAYAHSFAWLGPLSHAEGGRHVAGALFDAWLTEHGRYAPRAWSPVLAAQRTEAMLTHAQLLLEGRDAPVREQVFATLIRQVRHLAKAAKRAPAEGRLTAAIGLMTGALCLPGAADQERAGKAALIPVLTSFAGGQLPDSLRRPAKALALAQSLLSLQAAYKARGLTSPRATGDAIGVMRLYLGALAMPAGDALTVLPGGMVGEAGILAALDVLRRPEGEPLLGRFGYARLAGQKTAVHIDLRGPASGAFSLSDGADRVVTAAGAPDIGLRAVSARMRDWADALSLPAAAATLDASGYDDADLRRDDGDEGQVATLVRQSAAGPHTRRLFLSREGNSLIGEDEAPLAGATYRFPLMVGTEARAQEDGRALLVLPTGRQWRFETANAAVTSEDGIYSGGAVPTQCRQLVLKAEREGVRWALRRL